LADGVELVPDLDAVLPEELGPPDARQLEDLWAGYAAGRQDGLPGARLHDLAVLLVFDADAALALQQHAQRHGVGHDLKVGRALHRGLDVAMRHAHAPALVDRGLRLDDAFLVLAVVVRIELVTGRDGGLEQRIVERVPVAYGRDLEGTLGAAAVGAVAVDE